MLQITIDRFRKTLRTSVVIFLGTEKDVLNPHIPHRHYCSCLKYVNRVLKKLKVKLQGSKEKRIRL